MKTLGGIVTAIVAIAAVVVLSIGMWKFNWFLEAKNAEKRSEVLDNAPNAQRGYRKAALDAIEVVIDPSATPAQVAFNTDTACTNIASIDPAYMTKELEKFKFQYC